MKTHRHERSRGTGKAKKSESPRYVVTGGAGFVGANLVAALSAREPDAEIIVVDDFRTGSHANIVEAYVRAGLPPFSGVVLPVGVEEFDFDAMLQAMQVDAVFHLAAITDTTVAAEAEMIAVNATPMLSLMQACVTAAVPLVYASSAATYGTPPEAAAKKPFAIASAGVPNNVYGFSKWLMESEHRRLASSLSGQPQIVGLRYFNVFGPGEARKGKMASMAYQLAKQILGGQSPRLFKDGSQARDQVYVGDVVACTMAAAGLGTKAAPIPGIYNVGSGEATSFADLAGAVRKGLGLKSGDREIEYFEMPAAVRAFYQDYTCADLSASRTGLGWSPMHDPVRAIEEYARELAKGPSQG